MASTCLLVAVVTAAAVNLTILSAEATSLHLRWGAAAAPAGLVYRVVAREEVAPANEVVAHTSSREVLLQGLKAGTAYLIMVTATLKGRVGKASEPVRALTFDDAYQSGNERTCMRA